jgi:hypothetical protein
MSYTGAGAVFFLAAAFASAAAASSPSPVPSASPIAPHAPAEAGTQRWIRGDVRAPAPGPLVPLECTLGVAKHQDTKGRPPSADLFRGVIKADLDRQVPPGQPGTRIARFVTFDVGSAAAGSVPADPLHPLVGWRHPVHTRYTLCIDEGRFWTILDQQAEYACEMRPTPGDWGCDLIRVDPNPKRREISK